MFSGNLLTTRVEAIKIAIGLQRGDPEIPSDFFEDS